MRIEQGVKVAIASASIKEDFVEGEIVVIENITDIDDLYMVKKIINGAATFHPMAFNILKKNMIPKLKNPDLYYDIICECYELDIAKLLNEDLKRGDV